MTNPTNPKNRLSYPNLIFQFDVPNHMQQEQPWGRLHLVTLLQIPLHKSPPRSCCPDPPSTHPGVELDAGAVLGDERAAVVRHVRHATQAAGVIHGPVVGASLVLVLQSGQLDGLDIHAGVHELPNPVPGGKASDETVIQADTALLSWGNQTQETKANKCPGELCWTSPKHTGTGHPSTYLRNTSSMVVTEAP